MIDLQLTSNYDLQIAVMTSMTSEQYFSARFGFSNTKNLWKDTHKSNTVDFNDWPPIDLQFWPPNSSYDLQWHLSSILVPDMDSQVQKTNIKTPICAIQLIFMFDLKVDLQLTSILVFFDWRSNLLWCLGSKYIVWGLGSAFWVY